MTTENKTNLMYWRCYKIKCAKYGRRGLTAVKICPLLIYSPEIKCRDKL